MADFFYLNNLLSYTGTTVDLVVWSLAIGLTIAVLVTFYKRTVLGSLVRAILAADAHDPATAKTLEELKLSKKKLLLRALRHGSSRSRLFYAVAAEDNGSSDSAKDLQTLRYFIPKELTQKAYLMYDNGKYNIWIVLGTILLIFVMAAVLVTLIPLFIQMLKNIANHFAQSSH